MQKKFTKLLIRYVVSLFIVTILLILSACIYKGFLGKSPNPDSDTWTRYKLSVMDSEAVNAALHRIKELCESAGTSSMMVVYDNNTLFEYGNTSQNTPIHSIRKSLLSALIGVYANDEIDITKTIGELKITDLKELTDTEKTATVKQLLQAQSGVYLPAALEPRQMQSDRPKRGSQKPGEYWFYNNWDFNVLGSIFIQQTGKDIFNAFKEEIANPIGMEDFDLKYCKYVFEKEKSIHPGYVFKMSARDLARFGQLYLNKGQWNGKQIIPSQWIEESSKAYYRNENFGYGYMWWVHGGEYEKYGGYNASGMYGNRLDIIPSLKLVVVHRVNSTVPFWPFMKSVDWFEYEKILKEVISVVNTIQN
ncbi:MAG: serine hydrolase [Bacteroidales bacterium]|nr:serine hydrolase [Bacteroidales bacterium]